VFFRGSRYYQSVADTELTDRSGRVIRYKRMRFLPEVQPSARVTVHEGDRLDLIAYRSAGDPESFWRICDANRALRPADLTAAPGRSIAVPGADTGEQVSL